MLHDFVVFCLSFPPGLFSFVRFACFLEWLENIVLVCFTCFVLAWFGNNVEMIVHLVTGLFDQSCNFQLSSPLVLHPAFFSTVLSYSIMSVEQKAREKFHCCELCSLHHSIPRKVCQTDKEVPMFFGWLC